MAASSALLSVSATLLLLLPFVAANVVITSYTTGTNPYMIAFDKSANVWITNDEDSTVSKLNNDGDLIGVYSVCSQPVGITVDSQDDIWVVCAETNNVAHLNNEDGSVIGTSTVGNGPFGIAILSSSKNVWVTNEHDSTVTVLDMNGNFIATYTTTTSNNNPNYPKAIAFNSKDIAWISTEETGVITMNSKGTLLGSYAPSTMSAQIAIDHSQNVWIPNYSSNMVIKYNHDGVQLATYTTGNNPEGIAIDKEGNIWITNYDDGTVTVLNSKGDNIDTYNVGVKPVGISIDVYGNVWIANNGGNTVSKITITSTQPPTNKKNIRTG